MTRKKGQVRFASENSKLFKEGMPSVVEVGVGLVVVVVAKEQKGI